MQQNKYSKGFRLEAVWLREKRDKSASCFAKLDR
jgi:hypothetical protein